MQNKIAGMERSEEKREKEIEIERESPFPFPTDLPPVVIEETSALALGVASVSMSRSSVYFGGFFNPPCETRLCTSPVIRSGSGPIRSSS